MNRLIKYSILFLLVIHHFYDLEGYECSSGWCFPRVWGNAEYLLWKIKEAPNPVPLVISGPSGSNPVLGDPGTRTVLGGKDLDSDWLSGGKFSIGAWFDEDLHTGIELSYLLVPNTSIYQSVRSNGAAGSNTLVAPFFNVVTGLEDSTGIAFAGQFSGNANLRFTTSIEGGEINAFSTFSSGCHYNLGLIGGFRYWNYAERLTFTTSSPFLVNPDIFKTKDNFAVNNDFYGAQLGAFWDYMWRNFIFTVKGKIALGATSEKLHIKGETFTNDFNGFGLPEIFSGGYFAQPSNIGKFKHSLFAFVTEADVNLGYDIFYGFRLNLGYSFLYASRVLRAGNQIDRNINPSQSSAISGTPNPVRVGAARPRPFSKQSDMWAHGLKVSLEYLF